jgi:two-component system, OmpR family, response regulator
MNPHILFVDDEAPIRELLSVCFRIHGVPVTTATTGRDARLLAANATFDLTILDLHLPDESGLDLLRFFKTEFPRMPVIIFTGMGSDKELVTQARAVPPVFWTKPSRSTSFWPKCAGTCPAILSSTIPCRQSSLPPSTTGASSRELMVRSSKPSCCRRIIHVAADARRL